MANQTKCGKCDGTGFIKFYAHNNGGRCNRCDGRGTFAKDKKVPAAEMLAREIAERSAMVDSRRAHLATCTTPVTMKIARERLGQAEAALATWKAKAYEAKAPRT